MEWLDLDNHWTFWLLHLQPSWQAGVPEVARPMDDNVLTSSLPNQVGSLVALQWLFFSTNALAGSIPSDIGTLVHLESLFLQNNALTGSVEQWLMLLPSRCWKMSTFLTIFSLVIIQKTCFFSLTFQSLRYQVCWVLARAVVALGSDWRRVASGCCKVQYFSRGWEPRRAGLCIIFSM